MSLLAWIVLGFIAGFIASHIVNHHGEGMVLDILPGVVGAVVGGWVAHLLGLAGVTNLNLQSLLVATAGSIVFLFAYHVIRRNVVGRRVF
jgi:uncharacterized membrane protein YeaQ/YmgE (transglycosylase-associated protein family)